MLSQIEISQTQLATPEGQSSPEEIKVELLAPMENDDHKKVHEDDHLCCDLGIDQPDRYVWTTFDNCRALGGKAADNSKCGH